MTNHIEEVLYEGKTISVALDEDYSIFYSLEEMTSNLSEYGSLVLEEGKGDDELLKEVEEIRYVSNMASEHLRDISKNDFYPETSKAWEQLGRYAQNLIVFAHLRDELENGLSMLKEGHLSLYEVVNPI